MNLIDRVAMTLKPTSLMLDWINQHGIADEESLTLAEAQLDATLVLLPMFDDEEDTEQHLFEIHAHLFANELNQWNDHEETWPKQRDFDTFLAWFTMEFHASIYDTAEISLK